MGVGLWRCGMCAARNEPSEHTCVVCDTVRVVGRREESDEDDLSAPTESTAFSPEEASPLRVREAPPGAEPGSMFVPTRSRSRGEATKADEDRIEAETAVEPHHRRSKRGLPWWPQGTVRALETAVVGAVVLILAWMLSNPAGDDTATAPGDPAVEEFCPDRVSELVPGEGPGALEAAYETERHRIMLCSNSVGELFYFGEFLDGGGETMVVPAERTEQGYMAESGRTRYEIVGDEVVITGADGREMARLTLEPVEDPG